MLSVAEALDEVRRRVRRLHSRRLPLDGLLRLRLASAVASEVDSPPFDKAMVDGFALAADDPSPTLRIIEMVTAGSMPSGAVTRGTAIRIMTGSPIPAGADAVVKWEDCESIGEDAIRNPARGAISGKGILKRGAAFQKGQVVLPAGKRISSLDIALLAEIGRAEADAIPRPRVGVLPTGDELVAVGDPLGPGQIRNSNGPMLLAALETAGVEAIDLGIARDEPRDLREKIARGLECDVLLVSGGVSAGVKDLVPGVLVELGVERHFHQVRVKPGKPLWFGTLDAERGRTLVFGLPGNPVSTFVSFTLFALPAFEALAGGEFAPAATEQGVLVSAVSHRGNRPTYQPCRRTSAGIETLDWQGSADLATLTRADCLAVLPEGDYELPAGAEVDVLRL